MICKIKVSIAALLFASGSLHAQTPVKNEGAHESEYNSKLNGENSPSKTLRDATYVSEINAESLAGSESIQNSNPVASTGTDGTGTKPQASINTAGSPIPGSKRTTTTVEKSKATDKKAAATKVSMKTEEKPAPKASKKKKKR